MAQSPGAGREPTATDWTFAHTLIGAVARIELAPRVSGDFDRFVAHMERFEVEDPPARIDEIIEALDILIRNPLIGRRVSGGKRELVFGAGSRGYIALYRFATTKDVVLILAIRSQSEDGYKRGP